MSKNKRINNFSFNREIVAKHTDFPSFYAVYKPSAYTEYDEATQKKMLQDAFDILHPQQVAQATPKKEK